MLDGRIDSQGTIQDLRAQGILADLAATADVELKEESVPVGSDDKTIDDAAPKDSIGEAKKPAKLIEDEKREIGAVKWHIYGTYIVRQAYYRLDRSADLFSRKQRGSLGGTA